MIFAQIVLILGGARSGKSQYAEKLAAGFGHNVLYIATAEAKDEEMSARIEAHQAARPEHWRTLEAPLHIAGSLSTVEHPLDVLLLDCLTLLATNLILSMEGQPEAHIQAGLKAELDALIASQARLNIPLIIVSNEVGLGLVPPYPTGRLFRDVLGRANQYLAARADRVIFMVAGLPVVLKP
jgi:adenosylcobinamide kinase/adenosylcobinamide-phosphate guanylyltransferase